MTVEAIFAIQIDKSADLSIDEIVPVSLNATNVSSPMAMTLVSASTPGVLVTQPGGAGSTTIRFVYDSIGGSSKPWHVVVVEFTMTTTADTSIWNYRLHTSTFSDESLFLMNVVVAN